DRAAPRRWNVHAAPSAPAPAARLDGYVPLHFEQHAFRVARLRQEAITARLARTLAHRPVRVRCHHDDGDAAQCGVAFQLGGDLRAGTAGERVVEQNQIGVLPPHDLERVLAGFRGEYTIAVRFEIHAV